MIADAPVSPYVEQEPMRLMDPEEFLTAGYLQEINRRFLHPLGLALAMFADEEGPTFRVQVWDERDGDPEGFVFMELDETDKARGQVIEDELSRRLAYRESTLGFGVQPLA